MNHTVLLVEDESAIADTLQYAISSDGMNPLWVRQGSDATECLKEKSIDLIILDVGLPDCNGFELLKEIRKQWDLPVMMLTARSPEVDRIVGLEIGADDYVTKPFSPREVVGRIRAILKRTSRPTQVHSESTFEHDSGAYQYRYHGQPLNLTRSEYYLLQALISRPGQIFSRRQLIEKVWSDQHPSDDRVIDTHVKSLRAKLKKIDNSQDVMMKDRGFGYSMLG